MQHKIKTIIITGPPGSGKSTVISRMYSFNIKKISAGDLLRAEIERQTGTGKEVQSYMDRGKLVPSTLVKRLISADIDKNIDKDTEVFLFDGFPRNMEEVRQYFEMIRQKGLSLDAVIMLELSEGLIKERVLNRKTCPNCGAIYNIKENPPSFPDAVLQKRKDDDLETLEKQIAEFRENTEPVMDYFKEEYKDIVIQQDASPPVNQVMYHIYIKLNQKGLILFKGEKDE